MKNPYKRITSFNPDDPSFVPCPSTSDLDRFEASRNIRLPKSYRDFCLSFGAGELGGFYRIATPMPVANAFELSEFDRVQRGWPNEDLLADYGQRELTDNLLFFSETIGGDAYAWLTTEVTNRRNHEYAVYLRPRLLPPLSRVASSFSEFIDNVCFAPKKRPRDPDWVLEPTYCRFYK